MESSLAYTHLHFSELPTGLYDHIPDDIPLRSLVTSAGVSKWQGLFVCVLICSEESGADRQRRQEERSHNKFPPARHKMSSFPWLRRAPSHPAEKSRHLKLCDMCHRHCHWASATDGAGIDRRRATGAGWGTHPSLVCVTSHPRQGCILSCHTNTDCIMCLGGECQSGLAYAPNASPCMGGD